MDSIEELSMLNKISIEGLLNKLEPKDREIITLWYIEGYTLNEIREIYNIKYVNNPEEYLTGRKIRVRIQKILEKMKKIAGESKK